MTASIAATILLAIGLVLWVPVVVFFAQVLAAGRRPSPTVGEAASDGQRPSVAVLMPAHNEASGIAAAIDTVLPQFRQGDRLLVVADNCTDDTAAIAAARGAEVIERRDLDRRGKGYALDHGVRHLAARPPEIVIVVDADCAVAPGSIDRLAFDCRQRRRPVQALYLMRAPPGGGLGSRMAEFAWAVRNEVRPLGWQRLGGPCQLMGTGMAFPWPLISSASLASASIVEDMQLGLELAAAGSPPCFNVSALVTSTFPTTREGSLEQRTRWEHGHLEMIATQGLPLLWKGLRRRRFALAGMALDLCVPPLAALALALLALATCSAVVAMASGRILPLGLALLELVLVAAAVGAAWRQVGRRSVTLGELLSAPGYMLAKIPIYVRLFTARQMQWIRTRRDGGES